MDATWRVARVFCRQLVHRYASGCGAVRDENLRYRHHYSHEEEGPLFSGLPYRKLSGPAMRITPRDWFRRVTLGSVGGLYLAGDRLEGQEGAGLLSSCCILATNELVRRRNRGGFAEDIPCPMAIRYACIRWSSTPLTEQTRSLLTGLCLLRLADCTCSYSSAPSTQQCTFQQPRYSTNKDNSTECVDRMMRGTAPPVFIAH